MQFYPLELLVILSCYNCKFKQFIGVEVIEEHKTSNIRGESSNENYTQNLDSQ